MQQLQQLGLRPGVVLRGYGGSLEQGSVATLVTAAHTADARVGDEALLIARRGRLSRSPWAATARPRRAACCEAGADLVIADDGLQHLRLQRDVEIVVVDGLRGFGNGLLLPAGPLREPRSRLQSISLVVQNGGARCCIPARCACGCRATACGAWTGRAMPSRWPRGAGARCMRWPAIGNPARFFALLRCGRPAVPSARAAGSSCADARRTCSPAALCRC